MREAAVIGLRELVEVLDGPRLAAPLRLATDSPGPGALTVARALRTGAAGQYTTALRDPDPRMWRHRYESTVR